MITVQIAIRNALSFLDDVYGPDGVTGVRLEEVELSEDSRHWYVTISIEVRPPSTFEAAAGLKNRDFKIFKVQAEDGKVESMRIGTLS